VVLSIVLAFQKNKKAAAELKKEIDAATPAASKVDP